MTRPRILVPMVALLTACTGVIGGGSGSGGNEANANGGGGGSGILTAAAPATLPVARLTRPQYFNTLRDLFAPIAVPEFRIPGDTAGVFNNDAAAQTPSPIHIEAFANGAIAMARAAMAKAPTFLGCTPKTRADEDACARAFASSFGKRAFRRPVASAEIDGLVELYGAIRSAPRDFPTAMASVVGTILQSPDFLYRTEIGDPLPGTDTVKLRPHEVANRLSYFLWNSMPDDALFAAAESGTLATTEGVETETRRLLADPKAHDATKSFFSQWLRFDKMNYLSKDEQLFPEWKNGGGNRIEASMIESGNRHVESLFYGQGTLTALLTDDHAWVNDILAPIYGVAPPAQQDAAHHDHYELLPVEKTQRSGILTNAGLMAGFAHTQTDAPILRGVFVLDRMLCSSPPPPPPNLPPSPSPSPSDPKTTRERITQQHEVGTCVGCHKTIDGVGFGFGNYDALGKWRTSEFGFPVDTTGVLAVGDLQTSFDGVVDLGKKLAASTTVHACVVSQWLGYALGRTPTSIDRAKLEPFVAAFEARGLDMRELVVGITTSDTFRTRPIDRN